MGQLVGCIAGMRAAAAALEFPVVSGNVSLYNETNGEAILPTPVVGGLGLIEDVSRTASIAFTAAGEGQIGREACRESGWPYVSVTAGAGTFKKKNKNQKMK